MLFQTTKSIISKIGATKELGSLFKKLSLKNVLIVTDEGVIKFDLEKLLEWINLELKLKKKHLNHDGIEIAEEFKKRFPADE